MRLNHLTRFAGVLALLGVASAPACAEGARQQDGSHPQGSRPAAGAPGPARPMAGVVTQVSVADAEPSKMRGRMTPQERRRLRSDVSDAGRSLYPAERTGTPSRRNGASE